MVPAEVDLALRTTPTSVSTRDSKVGTRREGLEGRCCVFGWGSLFTFSLEEEKAIVAISRIFAFYFRLVDRLTIATSPWKRTFF